jgi:hypothetical protein
LPIFGKMTPIPGSRWPTSNASYAHPGFNSNFSSSPKPSPWLMIPNIAIQHGDWVAYAADPSPSVILQVIGILPSSFISIPYGRCLEDMDKLRKLTLTPVELLFFPVKEVQILSRLGAAGNFKASTPCHLTRKTQRSRSLGQASSSTCSGIPRNGHGLRSDPYLLLNSLITQPDEDTRLQCNNDTIPLDSTNS